MKCKEEAYSPRRLTIRNMQCDAVPCHVMPHFLTQSQPVLEQTGGWESKPEKRTRNKSSILLWPGVKRHVHPSHPNPSIHRTPAQPKPTVTSCQRGKTKAQTTKSCASFQKSVPVIPLTEVAKTINTSDLDCHVVPRDHGYYG